MAGKGTPRTSTPPVSAQFAALEPIWAGIGSAAQLRSLLVFGALFNARVYVHDTQLIDNPHVVGGFSRSIVQEHNLYHLLKDLIRAGVIVVGLREANYLHQAGDLDPCHSLVDVLHSWERNSPDGKGWVLSPVMQARRAMVSELDEILNRDARVLSYDYVQMKQDFMRQVRESSHTPGSVLARLLAEQPTELRRGYDELTAKSWFSHTPIFALLRDGGLALSHPLIQIHGIFDETAYARAFNARLLGSDNAYESRGSLAEAVLGNQRYEAGASAAIPSEDELISSAYRVVEGPPPELLAGLRFEEIMELRGAAAELFEIQAYFETDDADTADAALAVALAECSAQYWQQICDHIRRTRPHLAIRPTRLGIFLRRNLPTVAHLAERFATTGLSTLTEVAVNSVPVLGNKLSDETKRGIVKRANLEFVFFTESDSMRTLRDIYPHRGWIAPDARAIHS